MFYSAAFCLHDCPLPALPAELEPQLSRGCPALTDLAWQCVWGGHFVNEPFSKGSVSSVPGKSLLPWRYWLSFSCKRDATSIETRLVTCCDLILLPPPTKPRVCGAVICELFLHLLCCRTSGLNSAPRCCLRFLEDGYGRQVNLFYIAKAGEWRIIIWSV